MAKALRFAIFSTLAVVCGGAAFASHFTGTYADPQNGVTVTLQQGQDGAIQGVLNGPSGQFPLQGQGNQDGAYGTIMSTQGVLGFQAQLSPDGAVLQMDMYQVDQNNQPVAVGSLRLQRGAGAGAAPGGMGQPGMGQPGMPGVGQPGAGQPGMPGMGQPGMGQPGMGQPGMGQPGVGQPGVGQPGMPGMGQPGIGQPGMGQPGMPGMGQPGIGQPGMAQPGMPTMPGMGQPGAPATMPPPAGYPPPDQFLGWNGTFVGNGGQLSMFLQPAQQGGYEGFFDVSGQRFPLQARDQGPYLEGFFIVDGAQYGFSAQYYDGYVYLIEAIDGSEYILEPMRYGVPGSSPGQLPGQFPPLQPGGQQDAP